MCGVSHLHTIAPSHPSTLLYMWPPSSGMRMQSGTLNFCLAPPPYWRRHRQMAQSRYGTPKRNNCNGRGTDPLEQKVRKKEKTRQENDLTVLSVRVVAPTSLDFCRPDKLVASYTNGKIQLYDIETGKVIRAWTGTEEGRLFSLDAHTHTNAKN